MPPTPIRMRGSSPLARGLRAGADEGAAPQGIIPARAGFTRMVSVVLRRGRDHPRSRGVYSGADRVPPGVVGSSPLARGLLILDGKPRVDVGIIPARAGFTPLQSQRKLTIPGSSPLARGLRAWVGGGSVWEGIIPARAGFTPEADAPRRGPGDHPRSRGVYQSEVLMLASAPGSSPLARGLQG